MVTVFWIQHKYTNGVVRAVWTKLIQGTINIRLLNKWENISSGKPTICICENKDVDQLRSNCEGDQHLCFRCKDGTTPLLSKSKIFWPAIVDVQPGLCQTCSETKVVGFLTHMLILFNANLLKTIYFLSYKKFGIKTKHYENLPM